MKIAALLVNYRDAAATAAAARSVMADEAQTELVVVDNSEDDAHWQALLAALPASARAVRAPSNLGFGQGCNLAMAHTQAPLLMLVNPDVRLRRGCLQALSLALRADQALGAVAPRQSLDEEGLWLLPPSWLPTPLRAWATEKMMRTPAQQPRWARAVRSESLRAWSSTGIVRQRALSGAAMMVRREALDRAGGLFDPRFFMYFEDSDLCVRLRRHGWRMGLVAGARAVHAWRNAPHKGALMASGMARYVAKHETAENAWRRRRERLQGPVSWFQDMAPLAGPDLEIGPSLAEGWCVEVSPHMNMWPSVGRLGRGAASLDLRPALDALGEGNPIHIRLSGLSGLSAIHGQDTNGPGSRCWTWKPSGDET